ncbi:hypothetical protein DZA28_26315 [Pseudomonas alloputida]|uniref:Uncharacterized protein n=1 Tax=Pseudomonas alloputida TaxID=1940621 RepID=A0ABY3DDU3_9PSED|nr:hypothetical protein CHN49_25565 [Pseudomonas putida]PEI11661.1 hypothetical protein CRM86_07375 [Pseudomonas putida]QKL10450.1 hypothetical protein GEV41_26815 [Pseudomonas putida]TRZ63742.1 hypothetical protein DZA28_26315 [Pseudomonas alloputida]
MSRRICCEPLKPDVPAKFIVLRGFVGAGVPAKRVTRSLAPASPVFAGTPAPTSIVHAFTVHRPSA